MRTISERSKFRMDSQWSGQFASVDTRGGNAPGQPPPRHGVSGSVIHGACCFRLHVEGGSVSAMNDIQLYRVKSWVEQARSGDQAAFSELVREFHSSVWRFILKSVHNPSDAEELAQETFISAWRSLPTFRGDSKFSTWLLGIALNLARNHCNRSASRKEVALPEEDILESLLPQADDPSDLAQNKQTLVELDRAIARLPQELRDVIILVRLENLALEEAATLLQIPLGTVKSRLNRARERLVEEMFAHIS